MPLAFGASCTTVLHAMALRWSLVVHRRRPLMLSGWANASVDSISAHAIAYNLSSLRRAAPHLIDPLAIHRCMCGALGIPFILCHPSNFNFLDALCKVKTPDVLPLI